MAWFIPTILESCTFKFENSKQSNNINYKQPIEMIYFFVSFTIFVTSILFLRTEVKKFLNTYGEKKEYQQFLNRLCYYYCGIIATVIVVIFNIILYLNISKNDFLKYSLIFDKFLLLSYIIVFDLNSTKLNYIKSLFTCSNTKNNEDFLEIKDKNGTIEDYNISIY